MPAASVIVSFYNNVKALKQIISSLESQLNNISFEVIVADDGSNGEAVQAVDKLIASSPLKIKRVSQLDNGFRKTRALNKAINASESNYLIFIDGDCIPQANFVEDHLSKQEQGVVVAGRRADIPVDLMDKLFSEPRPETFFKRNLFRILFLSLTSKSRNVEKGVRVKTPWLSNFLNRKDKGILGCNFSIHKSDFQKINGFDNRYEAPSVGEDTDIEFRLRGVGLKVKSIFFQACMVHPMHSLLPRPQSVKALFESVKKEKAYIAQNGLKQANKEE